MSRTPTLRVAEPSAQYLVRPPIVADCSALAAVLFQEPWQDDARMRLAGHTLYAPCLLETEICSVALKKARRGAELAAAEGLAQWQDLQIELVRHDAQATFALAQQYQLTAYDAAYLWLAAELKCPLATFDEQLAQAAKLHLASLG